MPASPPRRKAAAPPKRPTAIVNLRDEQHANFKNWLVYGQSGVGKSALCGTAPNSLLLSAEPEGSASAKALGSTADELVITDWPMFVETMRWLEASGHKEYDWVSVDGLTELEEHAWNTIMAGGKLPRSIGGGFRQKSRNDYPLVWDAIKDQVGKLNRMPINVLYTAQTMRVDVETDDGEDTTLALPLVGSTKRGDLATKICGAMTLVGYYRHIRNEETGKRIRRLHTQDGERWVAKDRHDTFGAFVDHPSIPAMVAAVEERLASPGRRTPKKRRTSTARTKEQ